MQTVIVKSPTFEYAGRQLVMDDEFECDDEYVGQLTTLGFIQVKKPTLHIERQMEAGHPAQYNTRSMANHSKKKEQR
jgi:hypothetical protein